MVKRAKPTKLAFNSVQPIIIVGDDHGSVVALKLSPNLRKVGRQACPPNSNPNPNLRKVGMFRP